MTIKSTNGSLKIDYKTMKEVILMSNIKLGVIESIFADIIWENAPLTTRQLVNLSAEKLEWKRTTTYTVLKKLCERGIFSMGSRMVNVLISKEEFHAIKSEEFVKENFQSSLPAFIAAFTSRQKLTAEEIKEIRDMVNSMEENM